MTNALATIEDSKAQVVGSRAGSSPHCEPFSTWSLLDMLQFYAVPFSTAFGDLERIGGTLALHHGKPLPEEYSIEIRRCAAELRASCKDLPISVALTEQLERMEVSVQNLADQIQRVAAVQLVSEVKNNLSAEMGSHCFLMIPDTRRILYEQLSPAFGTEVHDAFPNAEHDIAAAARCFALDEWTACVFHLMRVLEHGLRWLAVDIGAKMTHDIDLEMWGTIIDMIEVEIRRLEKALKKGKEKVEQVQFYSEAASQFWYFKGAWRNHVSHSKASYDEQKAKKVLTSVRDFMLHLSTKARSQPL